MIQRRRISRKMAEIASDGRVIDLPATWIYTITCPHHGEIKFNFETLRRNGRDNLAGHVRDAVWSMRHELVGTTLQGIYYQVANYFWAYLDELESTGKSISVLCEIDDKTIKAYLAWLETRLAQDGPNAGRPLSISAKKGAYVSIKTTLRNRMKVTPEATNPALKFPKSPFPNINRLTPKREPYSKTEQAAIIGACNRDLRVIHEGSSSLAPSQVLAVHLITLAMATGRNFQGLLELRLDSLRPHPLGDREILVTEKRRGGSPQVWSYSAKEHDRAANPEHVLPIPTTVGNHIRWLTNYTEPLRAQAVPADRDFIFLWEVPRTGRHPRSERQGAVQRMTATDARNAFDDFRLRHQLRTDSGDPLSISIARCRPTFGTNLYERTRDIRKVQLALGHGSAETTARHYITLPAQAERDHVFVGQAMFGWITSTDEGKARALAADGRIPLENVRELLTGGYNTVVARCKNPFRDDGDVCGKYMSCFRCPQMVVFEDDLWRLYSFYFRLLAERNKIAQHHWVKTYGPVVKTIDNDIASQFPTEVVEAAKLKAKEAPHPAWATGRETL